LDTLFAAVTDSRRSYGSAVTFCEECGYNLPGVIDTFGHYIDVYNTNVLRRRHPAGPTLSQWFQYHFDCEVNQCTACRSTGRQKKNATTHYHSRGPLLTDTLHQHQYPETRSIPEIRTERRQRQYSEVARADLPLRNSWASRRSFYQCSSECRGKHVVS
jgi:hypothetical protein